MKNELEVMPKVSDQVSLIAGSGMGGYVYLDCNRIQLAYAIDTTANNRFTSILMGRLRMETLAAIEAYDRFCNNVFTNQKSILSSTRYDWGVFEKTFRAIAKDAGFDADDPMEEENPKCKTYVCLNRRRMLC
jgi:hypothetical protein